MSYINDESTKFKATVKWSGNHYHHGEEVRGSKIETRKDGTTWLFDDSCTLFVSKGSDGQRFSFEEYRCEWVEVDPSTIKKL